MMKKGTEKINKWEKLLKTKIKGKKENNNVKKNGKGNERLGKNYLKRKLETRKRKNQIKKTERDNEPERRNSIQRTRQVLYYNTTQMQLQDIIDRTRSLSSTSRYSFQ